MKTRPAKNPKSKIVPKSKPDGRGRKRKAVKSHGNTKAKVAEADSKSLPDDNSAAGKVNANEQVSVVREDKADVKGAQKKKTSEPAKIPLTKAQRIKLKILKADSYDKSALRLFKDYIISKNEFKSFECIPGQELDVLFREFLVLATEKDGSECQPEALYRFISSLYHYLKQNTKWYRWNLNDFNISKYVHFVETIDMLKQSVRKIPKAPPLSEEELDKMYANGVLGDDNPWALLHSLWLVCIQDFGLKPEEVYALRWGDLALERNLKTGTEYLILISKFTKFSNMKRPKVFAQDDMLRDPVHIYKIYKSNRPKDMLTPESRFFLCPSDGLVWYKSIPLGIYKTFNLLHLMKVKAGIETPANNPIPLGAPTSPGGTPGSSHSPFLDESEVSWIRHNEILVSPSRSTLAWQPRFFQNVTWSSKSDGKEIVVECGPSQSPSSPVKSPSVPKEVVTVSSPEVDESPRAKGKPILVDSDDTKKLVQNSVDYLVKNNDIVLAQTHKQSTAVPLAHLQPKEPVLHCTNEDRSNMNDALVDVAVTDEEASTERICAVSSKLSVRTEQGKTVLIDLACFWCNFCSFQCNKREVILEHVMEHRFGCKYCDFKAFSRVIVIKHSAKEHPAFSEYTRNLGCCGYLHDVLGTEDRKRKLSESPLKYTASSSKVRRVEPQPEAVYIKVENENGHLLG